MNDIEAKQKYKHNPAEKKMLVRYGRTGVVGWFTHNERTMPKAHSRVMIKTERGLEIGEVVGRFCYKSGTFKKSEEAVVDYYGQGPENCPIAAGGKIVRYATEQDLSEERHINTDAKQELDKCRLFIREMNLPMKLVDIEHIFGGERIIFYFTADSRVDFRELVKKLAKEFQTRIEMRQVGSRDAAKIAADIEVCGQPCCCARFLKILKTVNMKMAKLQKATLDPSKISGYCGRLKCCLRYEDHTYRELVRRLPKKRTRVKTSHGEGIVVDAQVLTQLVSVKADDGTVLAVPVEEIEILELPPRPPEKEKTDIPAQEQSADEESLDDFDNENIEDEEQEMDFDNPTDQQDKPEQ
jgi:cell fate regulator YaaT (PSP1 superfamily)